MLQNFLFQSKLLFDEKLLGSMHFLPWIFNPFEWNPGSSQVSQELLRQWAVCRRCMSTEQTARNKTEQTAARSKQKWADANFCFEPPIEQNIPTTPPQNHHAWYDDITQIWRHSKFKIKNEDHPMPNVELWEIDQNYQIWSIWIDLHSASINSFQGGFQILKHLSSVRSIIQPLASLSLCENLIWFQ